MKPYRGPAAGARDYLDADRSRADDYYLAEGTGVAQRFVASPAAGVRVMAPLSGDGYEAWVAGVDPDTGVAKGRLRQDANAVRFVEVIVNGPKSWSLAAALHPDVSAALDGAQDRAAVQVIGLLAQHATTRVGPRGGQVQVPVSQIDAAVIRHYTSRAGDPHRHLHLQVNARVSAAGEWRGLHTVGVRDSVSAINGIGHAAVMTDPQFRTALAAHGYRLDEAGEITQLAPYVGAFSRRAAQIADSIERYETAWIAAHPGQQPGPALRRRGMPARGPRTDPTRSSHARPPSCTSGGCANSTPSATTTTIDPPISSRRPSGDWTATPPPSWSLLGWGRAGRRGMPPVSAVRWSS